MMLVLAALLPLLFAAAPSGGPAFPDTPLGQHVRAWFQSYAAGDSASIDAFARAHVAPASLARTPMADRVRRSREIQAEHGALTMLSIADGGPGALTVHVRDAHGDELDLTFMGDPAPPNLLTGVRWELGGPGPGGPGPGPGPDGPRGGGPAKADASPLTEPQAVQAIRDEIARRGKENDFSGVVMVQRGEVRLVSEARGVADRERGVAITPGTRFNFASIGKAFTKTAIAQLAQAGKLKLDDPVTKYLPWYRVANAEKITLDQLVQHRGGVDDVLRYADESNQKGLVDVAAWTKLIADRPLLFPPGTSQRYSNGGYVLLGGVIERVAGEDYFDYVKRHVFDPAGMTETAWDRRSSAQPPRAVGYTRGVHRGADGEHLATNAGQPRRPVTGQLPERGCPAGGGYTSAPDLLRFAHALRARKLASGGWTAWLLGDPPPGGGATADTTFAQVGFGIAGGSPGTNGELELSGPWDIVVLTNDDPPGAEEMVRFIRDTLARVRA